jgi:hypothetical protein
MAQPTPTEIAPRLTGLQWLICVIASIGFAFDTYALLVLPLIVRPALMEMSKIRPGTYSASWEAILPIAWDGAACWSGAF